MGLCCTPLWRDSMKYLKTLKDQNSLKTSAYVCVILKAFEEKEIEIGWSLIQTIYNQYEILPIAVFTAWFNHCENNKNLSHLRVLEFLRNNECIVRANLAELIYEKYKQFDSKITTTKIKNK